MKKKIIVLFTSLLLMIPLITVSVHAEDVILYWDGIFYAYNNNQIVENAVTAYNTGSRFLFPVAPTHHLLWSRGGSSNCKYCVYWLVASGNTNDFSNYEDTANTLVSLLSSYSVRFDYVDGVESSSPHTNFDILTHESADHVFYYVVQTDLVQITTPVVAGHISYIGDAATGPQDPTLYALGVADTTGKKYIEDIYYENPGYGFTPTALYNWASSGTYPEITSLSFFSQSVKNYMYSLDSVRPNGDYVDLNNPSGQPVVTPTSEPTSEPTAEPTAEPTIEPSESPSLNQQQQQYQTISENAVNVSITENDVISDETIQRLDQTLQNNNPYQTTFTTAVQTIDGFRQIGVKFAQTSEAFLDFLPSWVTDLLSLMFVLLFFFIVLRLLKVFHG